MIIWHISSVDNGQISKNNLVRQDFYIVIGLGNNVANFIKNGTFQAKVTLCQYSRLYKSKNYLSIKYERSQKPQRLFLVTTEYKSRERNSTSK